MQWVQENWIWILLGGGMIAMHLFGHGKHGGNAKSGHKGANNAINADGGHTSGGSHTCCGGCKTDTHAKPEKPPIKSLNTGAVDVSGKVNRRGEAL